MKYYSIMILAIAALAASGCSHTIQGVQQDAQNNAPVAQAVAQQAGQALDQADKSASAAMQKAGVKLTKLDHQADIALLTPEIKTDIIADKEFDTKQNQITVHSSDKGVYLTGHVSSPMLKNKAAQIASNVVTKRNVSVAVHDELTVNPG